MSIVANIHNQNHQTGDIKTNPIPNPTLLRKNPKPHLDTWKGQLAM